ncbi:MAG: acyl carrier protein [Geminicoccaceae bacterium]
MNRSELFDDVVSRVGEFLETDVSALASNDRLASSIDGLSSLKMMELVLYLEECFGVEFDESAFEHFETLQELVDYIEVRQPVPVAVDDA